MLTAGVFVSSDDEVYIVTAEDEHEERAAEFGERLLDAIVAADPETLAASIDANLLGLLLNALGESLHSAMIHYQIGDHESAWKCTLAMAPPIIREDSRRTKEKTARIKAKTEELRQKLKEIKDGE